MRILMPEWKSFGNEDIKSAFCQLGHELKTIPFSNQELHHDDVEEQRLIDAITSFDADFVFTFNYFPIISLVCRKVNVPYLSWVYDNPYVLLYSYTVIHPCNHVYVFDKELYLEFHNAGITTVHYLPLAANTKRLSSMRDFASFDSTKWKNQAEIAFIGSLYTEKHQFYERLEGITPYTRGYLEAIMHAQQKVYGYSFIKELLTPDIIADMKRILPLEPEPTSVATTEYLFTQYVLNRQITATERQVLLRLIGSQYAYDLYTPDDTLSLPGCINHGKVDYYDMAPYVFKSAKINLNITLRSITSGIPLRAFDILGAGGFLLTNYQEDFADCYESDTDYVYYESPEDMMQKIEYYLSHEKERQEIADNGFRKTAACHTYEHRIQEMLLPVS